MPFPAKETIQTRIRLQGIRVEAKFAHLRSTTYNVQRTTYNVSYRGDIVGKIPCGHYFFYEIRAKDAELYFIMEAVYLTSNATQRFQQRRDRGEF